MSKPQLKTTEASPPDVREAAHELVSRWLMESGAFHVGLGDGNTEPDYNNLIDRIVAFVREKEII